MMVNKRLAGFVFTVVALAGVGWGTTSRVGIGAQSDTISGPDTWIPFTLNYTYTSATDQNMFRQYRRSDGSTRTDQLDIGVSTISDHATGRYFRLFQGRWSQHPLATPPFDGRPFTTLSRATVTEVSRDDPRVRVVAAAVPRATFFELAKRTTAILCPELNMLLVWAHTEQGGFHQTTAFQLGEPAIEFAPPPGVPLEVRTELKGGPVQDLPSRTVTGKPGVKLEGH